MILSIKFYYINKKKLANKKITWKYQCVDSFYKIHGKYNLNDSFEMNLFQGSIANILSETIATLKFIYLGARPKDSDWVSNQSIFKFWKIFWMLLYISLRLQFISWQIKGIKIFLKFLKREFRLKTTLIHSSSVCVTE